MPRKNWHIPSLAALFLTGIVQANPFFAMDTAVRELNELNTVKQLGYAGIGWKIGPPEQIAAAADQVRQRELKVYALYAGATLTKTNLTWNPQIDADILALKGSDTIIWLTVTSPSFRESSVDGDAVAVPGLQRLAELAARHGARVAIYPHVGSWAERVQDAVRLAKKVSRPNLGATFNLCHCLMVGDEANIPELLTAAAPHLFLVTINGADTGAAHTKWERLIRPLDEGSYDVGIVLKQLKELNYSGPIGLQGYGVPLSAKENLTRSMNGWKKLHP